MVLKHTCNHKTIKLETRIRTNPGFFVVIRVFVGVIGERRRERSWLGAAVIHHPSTDRCPHPPLSYFSLSLHILRRIKLSLRPLTVFSRRSCNRVAPRPAAKAERPLGRRRPPPTPNAERRKPRNHKSYLSRYCSLYVYLDVKFFYVKDPVPLGTNFRVTYLLV